jgi:hypothetical protein
LVDLFSVGDERDAERYGAEPACLPAAQGDEGDPQRGEGEEEYAALSTRNVGM